MKCSKCGKDNLDRAFHCTSCGYRLSREQKETKESKEIKEAKEAPATNTLIEFPATNARDAKPGRNNGEVRNNGDWRAELSERVRQVKERRNMQEARGKLQAELEAAAQRYQQQSTGQPAPAIANLAISPAMIETAASLTESERHPNPIIDAALKRARRASEAAGRKQFPTANVATAPKLTPQTQPLLKAKVGTTPLAETKPQTQPAITTAAQPALALAIDIDLDEDTVIAPRLENSLLSTPTSRLEARREVSSANYQPIISEPLTQVIPSYQPAAPEPQYVPEYQRDLGAELGAEFGAELAAELSAEFSDEPAAYLPLDQPNESRPVRVIKESDNGPNYLDELIVVCEQNLSNNSAYYSQIFVAAIIDLVVSVLATGPFWLTSYLMGVDITDQHVLKILGSATLVIMLLYQTLTIYLVTRTFGMMFVGTHVINSNDSGPPSLFQASLRAIGYLFSLAIGGLGFCWSFVDRKDHRSLHDLISSTVVVRDF